MTLRWVVFLLGGLIGVGVGVPIVLSFRTHRGLTAGTHMLFVVAAPFTMAIAALWLGLKRPRAATAVFLAYGFIAGTCGGLIALSILLLTVSK